ncbi:MAG: L,D-transpeptidase [Microvirga sp.]
MKFNRILSRRHVLGYLGAAAVAGGLVFRAGRVGAQVVEDVRDLKPGEFTWHPDRSPDGPVAIIVSIPDQRVYVYRNGVRIAVSTCSSGRPGHDTPLGVFTILQMDKTHRSTIYDGAPMPDMERLTWSGVALHAGGLPGYPSSHGCVHLPRTFADRLFTITHVGTPVIIAGSARDPAVILHPGLVLAAASEAEIDAAVAGLKGRPLPGAGDPSASAALSIVVSSADNAIVVLENGDTIATGTATISPPGIPLGSHVLVFAGVDPGGRGLIWHAIPYASEPTGQTAEEAAALLQRIRGTDAIFRTVQDRLRPGAVLVTTDLPLAPDTRTGKDFVVLSTPDA